MNTTSFSLRDTARELGLLRFVEQDLERQQQASQIDAAFLKALRTHLDQRQRDLYQALIEGAERARQWRVLRALSRTGARRNPKNVKLHEQAGIAALHLERKQEAFSELECAVRMGSRNFKVLYELGQLYAERDRCTEAILAWETACAAAPDVARSIQLPSQIARHTAAEVEATQATPAPVRPQLAATPARESYLRNFRAEVARAAGRPDWLPRPPEPTTPVAPAIPEPTPASDTPTGPSRPAVVASPRRAFDWAEFWSALFSERMLRALLYLGAALLVISAFIWMAFNWNRFAAPVQLAVLGGITTAFYGCGWAVRSRLGLLRSGSTLIAIGAGWVAVIGWALANLIGLSPPQTWLLIAAICLPAYLATTFWLREEIFAALSAVASVNLLLAGLQLVGVGRASQGCALVALAISFVALAPAVRRLRDGEHLAGPPVWIAQALVPITLIWAAFALRGGWLIGSFDRLLLVGIWWLGAAHYLFALRRLGGLAYEQALAWVAPAALLLSAEVAGLHSAWHGVVLLATTPLYLLVAPARARAYSGSRRPWLRYRLVWPVYSTPYLLALLALAWPGASTLALLVASLGVTALCAASAWIFRQPAWAWLACGGGLLAGWYLALLIAPIPFSILLLGLACLGALYWLVGVGMEPAPRYARAPLMVGYGLLGLALALAFLPNPALSSRPIVFGLVIAISAASAALLQANRLAAICSKQVGNTILEPFFAAIAAALVPGWLSLLVPALPARMSDLILIGLGAAYLLGAQMLRPRDRGDQPDLVRLNGMLTALAVALSGLALAGMGRAQPLLSFGLLLLAWALGRLPIFSAPARRLDGLALGGGLLALGLALLPTPGTAAQALAVIIGAVGLYLLGAALQRQPGWIYLLGGLLCGGWLVGLRLLGLPLTQQVAWLAPAALLGVAVGLFAEWRGWPRAAMPGYLYGYALAAISAIGGLGFFARGQLAGDQAQAGLALAALAVLSVISALRFRAQPCAALAGLLPALAYLLTLSAAQVPLGRYGIAWAGLATIYLALATLPAQLAPAAAKGHSLALRLTSGLSLFERSLRWGFYLLSLVALLGGVVAGLSDGLRPLAPICLLLASAYGLGAYWLRRPGMVAVAAPLVAAGLTALFAGYAEPLAPTSARGLLWVILAWALVGLARRLTRAPAAYRQPIFATGFTLAGLACAWAIFDRPLLLITLGGLILLCLGWDRTLDTWHVDPRWRGKSLPLVPSLPPFLTLVALLTPAWTWLLLDTLKLDRPLIALGLSLLAAVWLGLAQLVRRRPGAALPFLVVCYTLVALAPALAVGWLGGILTIIVGLYIGIAALVGRPSLAPAVRFVILVTLSPLIFGLALGTLIGVGFATTSIHLAAIFGLASAIFGASARMQRRPLWVAAAAVTVPIAAISAVANMHPVESMYAITLLGLGLASLGVSWLLERLGADRSYGWPFDAAAGLCGLLALGLTALLPSYELQQQIFTLAPLPDLLRLALLCATLALFGLGAARNRDPLWLYGSALAALLAYPLAINLLGVGSPWWGVALLPGAYAAFGIGQLLERRDWSAISSWRPRLISPAWGLAWSLPAYLLALAGSLAAVSLSLGSSWPLASALSGATALSAWAALAWGRQRWQWLALGLGHMAYLSTVTAISPTPNPSMLPLVILPALLTCLGAGLWAERSQALAAGSAWQRLSTPSWAQSYYAFAGLDSVLAVMICLAPTGAPICAMVVGGVLAIVAGVLASRWRDRQLAMGTPLMLALGVEGLARLVGLEPSLRLMLLAIQGTGAWWLAQGIEWRAGKTDQAPPGIWPEPLRRWGHLANLGALLWAFDLMRYPVSLTPLSRGLALAGLFYIGVALRRRQLRLSYLGSGMLVAAWILTVFTAMPAQLQAYAIPAGLYLLAVGAAERWYGSPRRLCQLIELLGMLLLLGVSLWQSLPANFGYGVLLGAEALLIIVWGALQRVRLLFFGGIVVFLTNLGVQSIGPIQATDKALLAFGVGLVLVVVAVFVERRRDQLREEARRIWAQLETWG